MSQCIYKLNICLMGFLFVISIFSLIILIINIYFDFQDEQKINYFDHLVYIKFINLIIEIITWIIVIFFGVHSLIYLSSNKLLIYMKVLSITVILEMIIECFYFRNLENKFTYKNIRMISLNIITFLKIIFGILSVIFGICENNILLKEIESYPLNNIDDEITEDLYKNIILMSKEPNNSSLQRQYNQLRKSINQ